RRRARRSAEAAHVDRERTPAGRAGAGAPARQAAGARRDRAGDGRPASRAVPRRDLLRGSPALGALRRRARRLGVGRSSRRTTAAREPAASAVTAAARSGAERAAAERRTGARNIKRGAPAWTLLALFFGPRAHARERPRAGHVRGLDAILNESRASRGLRLALDLEELDQRHRSVVALARHHLHDAGVAAALVLL